MRLPEEIKVAMSMDIVRVNYECRDSDCCGAYTERQFDRERNTSCGRCGGPLDKLTLVVCRREKV